MMYGIEDRVRSRRKCVGVLAAMGTALFLALAAAPARADVTLSATLTAGGQVAVSGGWRPLYDYDTEGYFFTLTTPSWMSPDVLLTTVRITLPRQDTPTGTAMLFFDLENGGLGGTTAWAFEYSAGTGVTVGSPGFEWIGSEDVPRIMTLTFSGFGPGLTFPFLQDIDRLPAETPTDFDDPVTGSELNDEVPAAYVEFTFGHAGFGQPVVLSGPMLKVDDYRTQVTVQAVVTHSGVIIPAPGAVVLGGIGLGLVSLVRLRRRRK